jgi:pimeloyl-ACP methyl ester carboxylesterase
MEQQMGVRAPKATIRAQLSAVVRHDVRRRLGGIELPTLVVRPGRDLLVRPSNSERLAQAIPRARMLSLPQAGHGVVFQCASEVNGALAEHFLQSRGA